MRQLWMAAALALGTLFAATGIGGAPAQAAPLTTGVAGAVQSGTPALAQQTQYYYGGGGYYRRPYYARRYAYRRPYYARPRFYGGPRFYGRPAYYGRRCFTRPQVVRTPYGYRRRLVRICR